MHEIKNKKRPRAVRKKGAVRLTGKRFSRARKATIAVSGVLVAALAAFGINALFHTATPLTIDSSYGSVSIALNGGETYSSDKGLSGAEIFGRLNWKFRQQENWSADVQGTVNAAGFVEQDVKTFKRYNDGILISADVTRGFIPAARQFCYMADADGGQGRVVWHEAAGGDSTYNGMDTPWNMGAPAGNLSINYHEDVNNNGKLDEGEDLNGNGKLDIGFKATRGLPAYELSVYVIRPDTILHDYGVTDNGDGTFTLDLDLNPQVTQDPETGAYEGATVYYINQMIFTGGIDGATFNTVHASFTFDGGYNTVQSDIRESYTANMAGIAAPSSAVSRTVYDYETDVSEQVRSIYEGYFEKYMQMEATGAAVEVDAAKCLATALGPVLNEEKVLDVGLDLNGKHTDGKLYLDLNTSLDSLMGAADIAGTVQTVLEGADVRAQIGSVGLELSGGVAYLKAGDKRISLDVPELLSTILPKASAEPVAASAEEGEEKDILSQLMGGKFVYDEETGAASLNSLLSLGPVDLPIGFYFNIDEEGGISLKNIALSLEAGGVSVAADLRFGDLSEKPAALSDGERGEYIALDPYIPVLVDLFGGEGIRADVDCTVGDLTVTGNLDLSFSPVIVGGNLRLQYGKIDRTVSVTYADGWAYLSLGGAKLRVDGKQALPLVTSLLGTEAGSEENSLLEKLFGLHFNDLLEIGEDGGVLSLCLKGAELLRAFGLDLGDISLSVGKNVSVNAEKWGLSLALSKAAKPALPAASEYADASFLLEKIPALLAAKGISLAGSAEVTVGSTKIGLEINEGSLVSWENGLRVGLDAVLLAGDSEHGIKFSLEGNVIKLACDGVGFTLNTKDDIAAIEAAVLDIYDRIRAIVDDALADGNENFLPEIKSLSDIVDLISGAAAMTEAAKDVPSGFDWTKLVQDLEFLPSARGGLFAVSYKGFTAEILREATKEGLLGVSLGYSSEKVTLSAQFHTAAGAHALPAMPDVHYIDKDEIVRFIGYLGSAVDLFKTTDLTLQFNGKVTSADTEKYPPAEGESAGVKYLIDAKMYTHRGKSNIFHIDAANTAFWVDADVFAHVSVNIAAQNRADNSLFIDFYMLDAEPAAGEAKKDGMLDFYVTLSQYGPVGTTAEEVAEYQPVMLYAPAGEILSILSAALPLMGMDVDLLNNYMVYDWLQLETVAQLKAFAPLVNGLLNGLPAELMGKADSLLKKFVPAGENAPAAASEMRKPFSLKDYITEFSLGAEELNIVLNSSAVYGMEGLENVQATLTKSADVTADGVVTYGKFTKLDLLNIYDGTGTLNTSLNGEIFYDPVKETIPTGEYQSFLGAEKLLFALVQSATHATDGEVISGEETAHTYALNRNFYIDGTATIRVKLAGFSVMNVPIRIIAISVTVDENGDLGINLRLEYDGAAMVVTLINGASTVDITIKNGMVYVKRVQTTYQQGIKWPKYETPVTRYRVMPLSSFTADILDHIAFILNFGSIITDALASAGGSGSGATTSAKVDFGKRLSDVLGSYAFTEKEDGTASWELLLHGDAFVKGVLGDISVTIGRDKDGYIRDISAGTSIVSIIEAQIDLRWRNAGGTMEKDEGGNQIQDVTVDVEKEEGLLDEKSGFGGMIGKLLAEGWGGEDYGGFVTFLEGERKTVTFQHEGNTLGTQGVIASNGEDGNPQNTLYSNLDYPDVSGDAYKPGDPLQVMGWQEVGAGETLPADLIVRTAAHGKPVEVTFRSKIELGDNWLYDEGEAVWYFKTDMWYGAEISLGDTKLTVPEESMTVDLWEYDVPPFAENARNGHWQKDPEISSDGAKFVAEYDPDRIVYRSVVPYTVTGVVKNATEHIVDYGTDYSVYTPSAKGYIFVGWYEKQADGSWSKVDAGTTLILGTEHSERTLEAVWVSNISLTLTKAERSNKQGTLLPRYTHDMEALVSGGRLVGAFADDAEFSMTYRFDAPILLTNTTVGSGTLTEYPQDGVLTAHNQNARSSDEPNVHVQIKYTYGGVTVYDSTEITVSGEWTEF